MSYGLISENREKTEKTEKERKFKETEKIQTQRERERAEEKVFHGSVAFPLVVDFGPNFLSKKRFCFLWRKISPARNKLLFRFHFCFRSCLLIYKGNTMTKAMSGSGIGLSQEGRGSTG
jgi:hypothetical protein